VINGGEERETIKNVSVTMWLMKRDEKCFGNHVVLKRADAKCFRNHMVNEKCFRETVVLKRAEVTQ
jgi:hypothetical protein